MSQRNGRKRKNRRVILKNEKRTVFRRRIFDFIIKIEKSCFINMLCGLRVGYKKI